MFKNLITNIQTKYNTLKQENEKLNQLLETTTTINDLYPILPRNEQISEHTIFHIMNDCPDINEEKAIIITKIIPLQETILNIYYTKEIKTNKEYYLALTNQYLWIINKTNYGAYPYNILSTEIIKNNILSKIILLNNILLEINGNDEKINHFIKTIQDNNYRNNLIQEKTKYLLGIIPIYQQINKIGTGISIDNNNNIIFHTKEFNYKYNKQEIDEIELLFDNQIFYSRKKQTNKIPSFENSFYKISINITTNQGNKFNLPILEPNNLGTKYKRQDTIFRTNLDFAKKLITTIEKE